MESIFISGSQDWRLGTLCGETFPSRFCLCIQACICECKQQQHKQLIQQYLAGVFATLLVSSADHVIQDVHLLCRVHPVHLLTWTLGDDWHLHFLQSPDSWQRDWGGGGQMEDEEQQERKTFVFLQLNRWPGSCFFFAQSRLIQKTC